MTFGVEVNEERSTCVSVALKLALEFAIALVLSLDANGILMHGMNGRPGRVHDVIFDAVLDGCGGGGWSWGCWEDFAVAGQSKGICDNGAAGGGRGCEGRIAGREDGGGEEEGGDCNEGSP